MEIAQLVTFAHVAELGSLSKASERLHIVQPALSRQIKLLEEELGQPLFHRHGRGMSLTAAGTEALEHAMRILAEIEAMRASLSRGETRFRGLLRLGMPPTVTSLLAVPLMARIRGTQPELQMRFSSGFSGHLIDWLRRGELDLAISYDPPPNKALKVIPILIEQLYLVSADPALAQKGAVGFAELARETLVLPSPGHGLRTIFDQSARQAGIEIGAPLEADSFSTIIDLTRAGFGATLLPRAAIHQELARGTLYHAPLVAPTPSRRLVICMAADRQISPAARHLSREIQCVAQELVSAGLWDGQIVTPDP